MEVIKVTPRGYCKGVTRAIALAKKTALENPDRNIYVLGMLVHNQYVMQALAEINIIAVDDKSKTRLELLDEIPADSIVIFTAHGIAPDVIAKAKVKNLTFVDASCLDVVRTQDIVKTKLLDGYDVLYIGKKGHPEAEAICSLSSHVHLITTKQELFLLPMLSNVFVTNQTTMSIFDVEELFEIMKQRFPTAIFAEEICNATRIRQEAVYTLKSQEIDVLYVVGDKYSNNSNRLAQIAKEIGIPNVYLIDDVLDIQDEQLTGIQKVAITSGASTPTYLTAQVIDYLENYENKKEKPTVDIHNIL